MATQVKLPQTLPSASLVLKSLPPLLSFFSGAGFLDLGLLRAGFQICWSLEADPKICEAHNYGMASYFEKEKLLSRPPLLKAAESIVHKGPRAILREATGFSGRGEKFGIVGGPPCPDFSVGGKNLGEKGQRGQLTRTFIERICELEPVFFLIENVKGLVSTQRHREFLNSELWKLEEKGYAVDLTILNALDLGIPQSRERLFVVGVKRGAIKSLYGRQMKKGERSWFPWPVDARFEGAKKKFSWPDKTPFGATPKKPEGIPEQLFVGTLLSDPEKTEALPNGAESFEPYSKKFRTIWEGDDSRKSFKRLHRYRYSPTAAYGNNEVHLHPTLPRRLTVREALRIQTVPDSFALPPDLTLSKKFKIVGNGVPVELARNVGLALARFLGGECVMKCGSIQ